MLDESTFMTGPVPIMFCRNNPFSRRIRRKRASPINQDLWSDLKSRFIRLWLRTRQTGKPPTPAEGACPHLTPVPILLPPYDIHGRMFLPPFVDEPGVQEMPERSDAVVIYAHQVGPGVARW